VPIHGTPINIFLINKGWVVFLLYDLAEMYVMRKRILSVLIAAFGFNLAGCDMKGGESASAVDNKGGVIKIASLPLMEESVLSLSPTFGGQRNDIIMQQVCALAKKEKTQDQFNQFFINKGIVLSELASKDPGFHLLAYGDLKQMQAACMAYRVSSAFTNPAIENLTDKSKNASEAVQIDNTLLARELSERLQVMNANAIFFSILSEKLERKPPESIANVKRDIINLASEFSPAYFEIIAENPMGNQHYILKEMHDGLLEFSSDGGYVYSKINDSVTLTLDGFNWYGEGELLGRKYVVSIENK